MQDPQFILSVDQNPHILKKWWTKTGVVTQAQQIKVDKYFCAACAVTADSAHALGEHLPD